MGLGDSDPSIDKGLAATIACSICLEIVTDGGERSTAKLQCGHEFHLDCIGSAFNAKGVMQCPNCRKVEKGNWLYANGSHSLPQFSLDEWTHDEDLYDLNYSEMPFGVHWCPFSRLARVPSSFEEGEPSPAITFQDLLGYHAVFSGSPATSSAADPCPYLAYIQPLQPSSSSNLHVSSESPIDGPAHHHHWSHNPGPTDVQTPHVLPAFDLNYHGWEHHSPTYSQPSSRSSGSHHDAVSSATVRTARLDSDGLARAGSLVQPFILGHGSGSRPAGSFLSSLAPPYLTNSRAHAHVRDHYQHHNPPGMHGTIFSGLRRSGATRGLPSVGPTPLFPPDQTSYYMFPPTASSSRSSQEVETGGDRFYSWDSWERDRFAPFPFLPVDRESGWWRPFPQSNGSPDSGSRVGFWHRNGSERPSSQGRSEGSSYRPALSRMRPYI